MAKHSRYSPQTRTTDEQAFGWDEKRPTRNAAYISGLGGIGGARNFREWLIITGASVLALLVLFLIIKAL